MRSFYGGKYFKSRGIPALVNRFADIDFLTHIVEKYFAILWTNFSRNRHSRARKTIPRQCVRQNHF